MKKKATWQYQEETWRPVTVTDAVTVTEHRTSVAFPFNWDLRREENREVCRKILMGKKKKFLRKDTGFSWTNCERNTQGGAWQRASKNRKFLQHLFNRGRMLPPTAVNHPTPPTLHTSSQKTHPFYNACPNYVRWVIPRLAWWEPSAVHFPGPWAGDSDLMSLQDPPQWTRSPGERTSLGNRCLGTAPSCRWACPSGWLRPLVTSPRLASLRWQPEQLSFAGKHLRKIRNVIFVPWW